MGVGFLPTDGHARRKNSFPKKNESVDQIVWSGAPRERSGSYCFSFRQDVHFIPTPLTDNIVIPPLRSSVFATANVAASWPRLAYFDRRTVAPTSQNAFRQIESCSMAAAELLIVLVILILIA